MCFSFKCLEIGDCLRIDAQSHTQIDLHLAKIGRCWDRLMVGKKSQPVWTMQHKKALHSFEIQVVSQNIFCAEALTQECIEVVRRKVDGDWDQLSGLLCATENQDQSKSRLKQAFNI